MLLKACDRRLQLSGRLADCLRDRRQQSKVAHQVRELLEQRVFGIACGYSDGNDAVRLKDDPVLKLMIGRDPLEGNALASQPTLSRFENSVGRTELLRMSQSLADAVIERHKKRKRKARLNTIDLDPTHDPTHGGQQLTFFNGFYDSWCYLPVAGFMSFDEKRSSTCSALYFARAMRRLTEVASRFSSVWCADCAEPFLGLVSACDWIRVSRGRASAMRAWL